MNAGHRDRYPKPFVAVMNGVVLGGGIGIAAHASHRIVTETSSSACRRRASGSFQMSAELLLSRAPGELGTHLAITAGSAGRGRCDRHGHGRSFITQERVSQLIAALETSDPVEAVLLLAEPAPPGELLAQREWIDPAYSSGTAEDIIEALVGTRGAHAAAATATAESDRGEVTDRGGGDARFDPTRPGSGRSRRRSRSGVPGLLPNARHQ